jgi:hypothetical protein
MGKWEKIVKRGEKVIKNCKKWLDFVRGDEKW